jgi:hypothetical protein
MTLTHDMFNLAIIFLILLGVVQCFLGYKLFKLILGISGFIIGGALVGTISYAFTPDESLAIFAGLFGGIIGALLLLALYYVGVFLIGAFLGCILTSFLYAGVGSNPEPGVILVVAVIAGVVALVFQKIMIIVSTSFGGSWLVVTGIAGLATGAAHPAEIEHLFRSGGSLLYTILLCWIALGIFGLFVQYKWLPTDQEREERDLAEYVFPEKNE